MREEKERSFSANASSTGESSWLPMSEIQIAKDLELVFEAYSKAFFARFGVNPNINRATDTPVLRDLLRQHGTKIVIQLVAAFVKTDGSQNYFRSRGHIIPLLRENANQLLIEVAQAQRKEEAQSRKIRIATDIMCDCCSQYYRWIGYPEDLEKPRYCETCVKTGESEAPLTKEDSAELAELAQGDSSPSDARPDLNDVFTSIPNKGTANARFVKMCRELYMRKITGRIGRKQFERSCNRLEKLARLRERTFGKR